MANRNYVNAFDSPVDTKMYSNRSTVLSNFSDSTFDETDFESLDYKITDRYGEYTRLSKDAVMLSTQGAACYNNVQLDGECRVADLTVTSRNKVLMKGKQNKMKLHDQQVTLYANDAMLKRESIALPIPRRNRRGNKVIRRISTIPSSVWHEVHGWPKLKTASVVLSSFVIGALLVLATIFIYKFIESTSNLKDGTFMMFGRENGYDKRYDCIATKLNGCKNKVHEKDINGRREHFQANCSKIHTEIIDSRLYILYEDRLSFSKAADFCHRTVRLRMLEIGDTEECEDLQNYMVLNKMETDSGYWTGQWTQGQKDGNKSLWTHVQPNDDIIITDRSACVFLSSNPRNCSRPLSRGCAEKKIPICKC